MLEIDPLEFQRRAQLKQLAKDIEALKDRLKKENADTAAKDAQRALVRFRPHPKQGAGGEKRQDGAFGGHGRDPAARMVNGALS